MNQNKVTDMATRLLKRYGDRAFEVSMPDEASYILMRATLLKMGRETGPDGEFFVVKVSPSPLLEVNSPAH